MWKLVVIEGRNIQYDNYTFASIVRLFYVKEVESYVIIYATA